MTREEALKQLQENQKRLFGDMAWGVIIEDQALYFSNNTHDSDPVNTDGTEQTANTGQ